MPGSEAVSPSVRATQCGDKGALVQIVNRFFCGICGCEKVSRKQEWFLMSESRWQDRLRILRWHDELARQSGLQCVCSAAHVQELVIHWMITGDLEYPFARATGAGPGDGRTHKSGEPLEVDTSAAQQIGELSVHRESVRRVLAENPQSLSTILDALLAALDRKSQPVPTEVETESDALCLVGGEI